VGRVNVMESGGKMAPLNYSGGKLITQVGPLTLPYGMNTFDKAGPVKYSIDLSLRGYDENPKVKQVYDAFAALDEYMIDLGVKNSRAWFKSDLDRNVVKAFYTPMIKVAKDADGNPKPYPPTVKINLKKNGDSFEAKVYDDQKRPYEGMPLEDLLVKGAVLSTLIQCTSIWFAGSKFGTSWKALQIRMDKVPESIRNYAFVDDDETTTAPAPVQRKAAAAPVAEFEDDADDDAFEAPAPAPAPAPAKKSAVAAVLPADDDAEDHEPVAAPKKTIGKKTILKAAPKKA
jgi:hypothetical protein